MLGGVGGELRFLAKSLLGRGVRNFYFGGGLILLFGQGSRNVEVKIKIA